MVPCVGDGIGIVYSNPFLALSLCLACFARGRRRPPAPPRRGVAPGPQIDAGSCLASEAHAFGVPRLLFLPRDMIRWHLSCRAPDTLAFDMSRLFFCPRGMTRLHSSGTGSFAGGVLGEPAGFL